jgi:hypothetical protein
MDEGRDLAARIDLLEPIFMVLEDRRIEQLPLERDSHLEQGQQRLQRIRAGTETVELEHDFLS